MVAYYGDDHYDHTRPAREYERSFVSDDEIESATKNMRESLERLIARKKVAWAMAFIVSFSPEGSSYREIYRAANKQKKRMVLNPEAKTEPRLRKVLIKDINGAINANIQDFFAQIDAPPPVVPVAPQDPGVWINIAVDEEPAPL